MALTITDKTATMVQVELKKFKEDLATVSRENVFVSINAYSPATVISDNQEYLTKVGAINKAIDVLISKVLRLTDAMRLKDPTHPEHIKTVLSLINAKLNDLWVVDALGAYDETRFNEVIESIEGMNDLMNQLAVVTNAAKITPV